MTEISEKIAVKRRIMTRVPGKKYSMKLVPPGMSARKLWPIPAPMTIQKRIGVASAPMIRLRWRTKRMSSRQQSEAAGRNRREEIDGGLETIEIESEGRISICVVIQEPSPNP